MNNCKTSFKHEQFAEKLNDLLILRGMRKSELSCATGLSKALISQYSMAKSIPSFENVVKISSTLNVSLFYWLPDDTPNKALNCLLYELDDSQKDEVLRYIEKIKLERKVEKNVIQ